MRSGHDPGEDDHGERPPGWLAASRAGLYARRVSDAVVQLEAGRLEGALEGEVLVLRGVPYARPPMQGLRWRSPEPHPGWHGRRPAQRFAASASQNPPIVPMTRRLLGSPSAGSEDCLTLNVWAPRRKGQPRPVMVWIHGGAFVLGSATTSLYDGRRLARAGDAIIVTINYRLGALGFLSHPALREGPDAIVPNLGLRDQIAALEWVRDNIADLGGDPGNVTIFGESAGAMSVGCLLAAPAARGLFRRAILQSGAASNVSDEATARRVVESLLDELGLPHDVSPERLRALPVGQILAAQQRASFKLDFRLGRLPFQPSVDGDLLPAQPLDLLAKQDAPVAEVMLGTNRDEWRLFLLGDRALTRLDEAGFRKRMQGILGAVSGPDCEQTLERALETYGPALGSVTQRWCAFQADRVFHAPAALLADRLTERGSMVRLYRFDWAPPLFGGLTGAFHGIEIPFVFGTVRDGVLGAALGWQPEVRKLSLHTGRAWLAFAKHGDPTHEHLPEWPLWSSARRPGLLLGPGGGPAEGLPNATAGFFEPLLRAAAA